VNPFERFEADLLVGGQQIDRLTADQSVEANRIRKDRREARRDRRLVCARQCSVGEIEQSEGSQDGDGFTKLEMVGLTSAAERSVVH
jgi:hypothetical protein